MKKFIIGAVFLGILMIFGNLPANAQPENPQGSIRINCDEAGFVDTAKISIDKAVNAALAKVPGKALKAELENEDGYLVYGVEIVKADHQIVVAKVDAGDGQILKIASDSEDREHRGKEGREREDSDRGHEEGER